MEVTENCRWAPYSTNQLNRGALTEEILKQIGKNVAARWRIILAGIFPTRGKGKLQKEKPEEVRVLHFECNV